MLFSFCWARKLSGQNNKFYCHTWLISVLLILLLLQLCNYSPILQLDSISPLSLHNFWSLISLTFMWHSRTTPLLRAAVNVTLMSVVDTWNWYTQPWMICWNIIITLITTFNLSESKPPSWELNNSQCGVLHLFGSRPKAPVSCHWIQHGL